MRDARRRRLSEPAPRRRRLALFPERWLAPFFALRRDAARRNPSKWAQNERWLALFLERWLAPFCLFFAFAAAGWLIAAQPAPGGFVATTRNGEWQSYTGDTRGTRYSPLDQITAHNFNNLEVAWRFKTDNLGTRPEYKLEGTPLMIGGELYATGGTRR